MGAVNAVADAAMFVNAESVATSTSYKTPGDVLAAHESVTVAAIFVALSAGEVNEAAAGAGSSTSKATLVVLVTEGEVPVIVIA